ncbi:MAG: hypothetical protein GY803_08125 [Chloroflexi bacterium]|nr:hypothetical protein [Chloroflexota bacterium]
MTNLISLQNIPLTKHAIVAAGTDFANQFLDAGEANPLDTVIKLRALRDAISHAIKTMESEAMDEAERYGDDRSRFGVRFQVRSGATKYGYDHDSVWAEMRAQETAVANQRKAREKFLRTLDKEMVDPETGEFIAPARMKSLGNTTLALTFPKE